MEKMYQKYSTSLTESLLLPKKMLMVIKNHHMENVMIKMLILVPRGGFPF